MTPTSIVVQQPAEPPGQLVLLFHGVGGTPDDVVPLGRHVAKAFPRALVVAVQSPHAGSGGRGHEWFAVAGITEENRPARIAEIMREFLATIRHWQDFAGLGPEATALVGFSQGGIMALEATKADPSPAQRVVAVGARFAILPSAPAERTTIHLIHGKEDRVIPYAQAIRAAEHLLPLGADLTVDVLPFVGHEVSDEVAEVLVKRLTGYVPQWRWRLATAADPGAQ